MLKKSDRKVTRFQSGKQNRHKQAKTDGYKTIIPFSLGSAHTCPFRRLRRHLPRVRGRLSYMSHFGIFVFIYIKVIISFSLASASPELGGKCRAKRGDRSQECVHRSEYLNLVSFAWILHSIPYFFTTLFPTAFYDHSRMTGRYLLPFRMKSYFVSAHSYFHSFISAHTCPFRQPIG